MSNDSSEFNLFNSLVGTERKAEVSKDGKAINVTGEIVDGITGTFSIRPSKSSGTAIDFNVDGGGLKHIEGLSKK